MGRRPVLYYNNIYMIVYICLIVWLDKTCTVNPLRHFHSRSLSFTQDSLAFSTKTTRRALQVQLIGSKNPIGAARAFFKN